MNPRDKSFTASNNRLPEPGVAGDCDDLKKEALLAECSMVDLRQVRAEAELVHAGDYAAIAVVAAKREREAILQVAAALTEVGKIANRRNDVHKECAESEATYQAADALVTRLESQLNTTNARLQDEEELQDRGKVLFREGSALWAVLKTFLFRVAMLVVNFGTGVTVARALAPFGRGEQTALALWPVLLPSLATLGLPLAIIYQTRRRPDDAGRFFFAGALIMIVVGFVVALFGAIAMPYILRDYDPLLVRYAQWFMLFAPPVLTQLVIRAHFEAHGEFTRSILTQLLPSLLTLAALLVLRFYDLLSPATAALCYLSPPCLMTIWLLIRTWPRMSLGFTSFYDDSATLLAYGLRSYGADLINALSGQIDVAIIVAFLNPTALGLYSVAISVAHLPYIIQASIVTVLFPHASGLEADAAIELVGQTSRLSLLLSIVFSLALMVIATPLLPVVYGSDFRSAATLVPLLIVEGVFTGLCWVLGTAFQTTGRPAVVTLIQTGWLGCALVLLIMLVPRLQTIGAAVALMLASLCRFVFIVICYRVVLHRGLPRLFPNVTDITYIYTKLQALISRWRSLSVEV